MTLIRIYRKPLFSLVLLKQLFETGEEEQHVQTHIKSYSPQQGFVLCSGMDSTECQFDVMDLDQEARLLEMHSIKLGMTKEILSA